MFSYKQFLFLVLALVATFFQSTEAFAGPSLDKLPAGDGRKDEAPTDDPTDDAAGDDAVPFELPFDICTVENEILASACQFLVSYLAGFLQEQLSEYIGDDDTDDAAVRKLRGVPN